MNARNLPILPEDPNDTSGRSSTDTSSPAALSRRAAMAAALGGCLAAGCATPLTFQSRYAGDMQGCATRQAGRATLVRQADRFSFAPSDGTLVIAGTVAADGSFVGSLVPNPSRHDPQGHTGTEAPTFTLTVTGRLDAAAATGSYTSPRCRVAFRLLRIEASLLP